MAKKRHVPYSNVASLMQGRTAVPHDRVCIARLRTAMRSLLVFSLRDIDALLGVFRQQGKFTSHVGDNFAI